MGGCYTGNVNEATRDDLSKALALLRCPKCEADLELRHEGLACSGCGQTFEVVDGIPLLFQPNEWSEDRADATATVRSFYEETPFPNYEEFDDVSSLLEKARRGHFAKLLDDQVPPGALVLECGCGTGQLGIFLSIANRTVFATDMSVSSLRLGQEFKERNQLRNVRFLQMNLFRPAVRPDSFDLVVANGVLHHTPDPQGAFESISRLVKPGGYVMVGLYHRYGRLITDLRRVLFRLSDRLTFLDPNLRKADRSSARWRAWYMDQYRHPLESKHTIGEVIGWFERADIRFVRSIPPSKPFQPPPEALRLFEPEAPGNRVERLLAELPMAFGGSREGGFFVVVGRKPGADAQKSV